MGMGITTMATMATVRTLGTQVRTVLADYANAQHAHALVQMLDAYARDPMGGGQGLSTFAKTRLVEELAKVPMPSACWPSLALIAMRLLAW